MLRKILFSAVLMLLAINFVFYSCKKEDDFQHELQDPMSTNERNLVTCSEFPSYPGYYIIPMRCQNKVNGAPSYAHIKLTLTAPNSTTFQQTYTLKNGDVTGLVIPQATHPDMGWTVNIENADAYNWTVSTCEFGWNAAETSFTLPANDDITASFDVTNPIRWTAGFPGKPTCLTGVTDMSGIYITEPWCAGVVYASVVKTNSAGQAWIIAAEDGCVANLEYDLYFENHVLSTTPTGTYTLRKDLYPLLTRDVYGSDQGANQLAFQLSVENGLQGGGSSTTCNVTAWLQVGNESQINATVNTGGPDRDLLRMANVGGCDYDDYSIDNW